MSKVKIENTEKLFNEWKFLSLKLEDMKYIIQNDGIEVYKSEVVEWNKCVDNIIGEIKILKHQILKHINNSNND